MSSATSRDRQRRVGVLSALLLAAMFVLSGCTSLQPQVDREDAKVSADVAPDAVATPATQQPAHPGKQATAVAPAATDMPPATTPPTETAKAPDQDIWTRLAMAEKALDCARLNARSTRWLTHFTREAAALTRDLQRAQPLIELVVDTLERQGVPLQFAMLPMVESQYQAPITKGNRPAGMWQLMPRTARGFGIVIQDDYDGRLDYLRSTEAAAALLLHLSEQFAGDWRLSNMAFNAGEFRIKSALKKRGAKRHAPDTLGVSKITLHHLAKLEALNCIIANPAQFGINLQASAPEQKLQTVSIETPLSTGFLAHLARVDLAELRRWNPALRGEFTPNVPGLRVLMPAPNSQLATASLSKLPTASWSQWGLVTVKSEQDRDQLLKRYQDQQSLVQSVNALGADTWPIRLWVPMGANARTHVSATSTQVSVNSGVHVIRSGETLWGIARRYGLALKNLMSWNRLSTASILRPGQSIRLRPP